MSSKDEPTADTGFIDRRSFVGCAGWNLPRGENPHFPESGTHLERYSTVFSAVEINSSFYRSHRPATYARWATSVPPDFRFAVKVPKTITHTARLKDTGPLLKTFLSEATGLGEKLGCLLVQLPPSLAFDPDIAHRFFEKLRAETGVAVVFEPRHSSWFDENADALLEKFQIARVAADPAPVPAAAEPGGWRGLTYYRLHGSPEMYRSAYSSDFIHDLVNRLDHSTTGQPVWCIFDNTTLGHAMPNARELLRELKS